MTVRGDQGIGLNSFLLSAIVLRGRDPRFTGENDYSELLQATGYHARRTSLAQLQVIAALPLPESLASFPDET